MSSEPQNWRFSGQCPHNLRIEGLVGEVVITSEMKVLPVFDNSAIWKYDIEPVADK